MRYRLRHNASTPSMNQPATEPERDPKADLSRRTVRVLERRPNGYVSFEFSIGWPELSVELLLPGPAFTEFCATQHVRMLEPYPDGAAASTNPTGDKP